MKNPFKKADSAKLPAQGKERTEIDYAHRTIVHHMPKKKLRGCRN